MKLYEVKYKELGCQCHVDPYLGDILNENPDCKYHNWLDETLVNELRSRGYNVKVTRTFTEEKEYFHE